jgi:hypothetical protein
MVVLALAQEAGKQVPHPGGGGPQPVAFVVVAQQHLGDGQADQLGVGDLRGTAWAAPADAKGGDDPVGEFHVPCDQEGVQVGDHEDLHGLTCVNTPILDALRRQVQIRLGVPTSSDPTPNFRSTI